VRERVLAAWTGLLAATGPAPAPTAALTALGSWPDDPFLSRVTAEARATLRGALRAEDAEGPRGRRGAGDERAAGSLEGSWDAPPSRGPGASGARGTERARDAGRGRGAVGTHPLSGSESAGSTPPAPAAAHARGAGGGAGAHAAQRTPGAQQSGSPEAAAPQAAAPQPAVRRQPTPRQLVAALRRARDATVELLDALEAPGEEAQALRRAEAGSDFGPLPLATQVHAIPYRLALALPHGSDAGLDAADAGPYADADPALLDAACASLIDVVGALAARRRLSVAAAAHTTDAGLPGWWFRAGASHAGGWTVGRGPAPDLPGPEAATGVLLDVAAGRRSVPTLLARRELRLRRLPQLLGLAPLLDDLPVSVPLPRALTGLLGRLPF